MTGCFKQLRQSSQFRGEVRGEKILDCRSPRSGGEIAPRHFRVVIGNAQCVAAVVEMAVQSCQPLIAHQHQKADFGKMLWLCRVEIERAVGDGIAPVGWQGLPVLQSGSGEALGGQTLDGIAVKACERALSEIKHTVL